MAVHHLTRLFLNHPDLRVTAAELVASTDLEPEDAAIVIETLKDAGFLVELEDGRLAARSVPAA